MEEQRFYFSRGVLGFIVLIAFSIGLTPFLFTWDRGDLLGAIMTIGGSPLIGYLVFGASIAVGAYHLPNLLRAITNKPAVTIKRDWIRFHQFPSRTFLIPDVKLTSVHSGSLLLTLRDDRKKWVNLKIVKSAQDCADAIETAISQSKLR